MVINQALPWDAAFLAGKAFAMLGGAAVRGYTLLTRDSSRYLEYFPRLRIIAP